MTSSPVDIKPIICNGQIIESTPHSLSHDQISADYFSEHETKVRIVFTDSSGQVTQPQPINSIPPQVQSEGGDQQPPHIASEGPPIDPITVEHFKNMFLVMSNILAGETITPHLAPEVNALRYELGEIQKLKQELFVELEKTRQENAKQEALNKEIVKEIEKLRTLCNGVESGERGFSYFNCTAKQDNENHLRKMEMLMKSNSELLQNTLDTFLLKVAELREGFNNRRIISQPDLPRAILPSPSHVRPRYSLVQPLPPRGISVPSVPTPVKQRQVFIQPSLPVNIIENSHNQIMVKPMERNVMSIEESCAFCSDTTHASMDCTKYVTPRSRQAVARRKRLCVSCLREHTEPCAKRVPCIKCKKGSHHVLLCGSGQRRI